MEIKLEPQEVSECFDDVDEAKNFIEKKFRKFERGERERLKIEIKK